MVQPPLTPAIDESKTINSDETDEFILGVEEALIMNLRLAISHAHRMALVKLGKSVTAPTSPQRVSGPERTQTEKQQLQKFRSKLRVAIDYSNFAWTIP